VTHVDHLLVRGASTSMVFLAGEDDSKVELGHRGVFSVARVNGAPEGRAGTTSVT